MSYLNEAKGMFQELVEIRRYLHQNPEIGFDLENTSKFVFDKLTEYGLAPEYIGENGVTALIGEGDRTVLLRADMDALPIKEESGLEFSSQNEYSHTCGHDIHTTSLLGAAKLLKQNESQLKGQIKFLFQPAEELLVGGKAMVEAGILENPKVDIGLACHVAPDSKKGIAIKGGTLYTAGNNFKMKVKGEGSHGARPHKGIDPVLAACTIVSNMQSIITREIPMNESAVITAGKFIANGSQNVIPGEVNIEGTVRTFNPATQEYIKKRLPEFVRLLGEAQRVEVDFEFTSDVPSLVNDEELTAELKPVAENLLENDLEVYELPQAFASEDFAFIAQEVPSLYFRLGMADPERENYPVHHQKVVFDEDLIPYASALFCELSSKWLEKNS